MDTAQLFNGVTYIHKLRAPRSESLASAERLDPASYLVEIQVTVQRPRASRSREDVASNDPKLAEVLDAVPGFWQGARVSDAFGRLYENKENWLRERLSRLDQLLSRHNYYDCETILEYELPKTGRRMLVMKGDMDVNVDGSDGDRNIEVDGSSRFFQPQTSYRWRKRTSRPNPFLAAAEEKLAQLRDEYAIRGLPAQRNAELRAGIQETSRRIYDLKTWSFLVSEADPSIVVPGFMLRGGGGRPALVGLGDYAVVIYQGKGYPAIVGDAGPSFKFGEASLRICREIHQGASANTRPVSHLHAAYIVFPGTADEPGPPDLALWNERCAALLAEAGLGDLPLHQWEDIVPPWPEEATTPAPATAEAPEAASPASSPPPAAPSPAEEQPAESSPHPAALPTP